MNDLTQGNETKLIVQFAVPMLIGNVLQQFYSVINSIVVGQAIGKNALAAVGASFPILFLIVSLVMGVTMGSTILIAQYCGAKDNVKLRKAVDNTYIVLVVMAIPITIIGLLLSESILKLLKIPPEVFPQAKLYVNILFSGIFVFFGYFSISAILRGVGDSKTPLYFLIVSTVCNVALVLLFVITFKWGVAGAGLAMVIAQGIAFACSVVYMTRSRHEVLRIRIKGISFDREIFFQTLKIGLPIGFQQMFLAVGMIAISRIVNGFGANAMAAYTAAGAIDSFAAMPIMNLSMAVTTFVGQNLGANKPERVKRGFHSSLVVTSAICVTMSCLIILFAKNLIMMFNSDTAVISIGVDYLHIVASFYVIFGVMFMINGVIRGAGDALVPMLIMLLSLWAIRIPLSIILSKNMGTNGIWWGIPIAWVIGCAVSIAYYLSGRWKRKVVVKCEPA